MSFSYTYTEKHTAVDVNKSFILISNRASNGTYDIPIRISSRTTNSFTIKGSLSGYTLEFSYQIIEFR